MGTGLRAGQEPEEGPQNPAKQELPSPRRRRGAGATPRERALGKRGATPRPRPCRLHPPHSSAPDPSPALSRPAPPPSPASKARKRKPLRLFRAGSRPGGANGESPRAGLSAGQGSPVPGAMSRNLRTVLIFGGFISLIGAAFYPIYFRPLMRLDEYRE